MATKRTNTARVVYTFLRLMLPVASGLALICGMVVAARASTVVVSPANMNGWAFAADAPYPQGTGSLDVGPATSPMGKGSVRMLLNTDTGASAQRLLFYTLARANTRFDQITTLSYSTYRTAGDPAWAISLQLDVDYDLTDANTSWQGRLVFEPYLSGSVGTVVWQPWDTLAGKWWASGNPGKTLCPQSNPCTWAQVLSNWPNAGIRVGGALQFKAGGPWPGFDGNADALTVGVNGTDTTYDFEPTCPLPNEYVAPGGSDAANDCTTSGTPCATIQHAVDAACAGNTINVAAGTYDEAVSIATSLTLNGAPGAIIKPDNTTPLLDQGARRPAVYVNGVDQVTVQGLEIDGTGGAVHYGIYFFNSNNSVARSNVIHDLTNDYPGGDVSGVGILFFGWGQGINGALIDSTTVFNCPRMGIFVGGMQAGTPYDFLISGGTLSNNIVHHAWQGPTADGGGAVQINAAKNSLIQNNVIHDTQNGWYGIYIAGSATGNTVTGNEIYSNAYGITAWSSVSFVDYGADAAAPPTVSSNSIHANSTRGLRAVDSAPAFLVNASGNWWGAATGPTQVTNPAGTGDGVSDNVDYSPWLADGTDTSPAPGFQRAIPTAYVVNPNAPPTYTTGGIQDGVNFASAGDTVRAIAGTYTEQVVLNKSVTLAGADKTTTIIQAPGTLVGDASGSMNILTVSGGAVSAAISGFTITGPGPTNCGSLNAGIFVRDGASANIHDNTVADIRDNPLSGCQNGQGIFVGRKVFGTTGTATITNNLITGYQKGGIVVDNTGSTATIIGNTVTGVGATAMIAQNGIQVSRGATATVNNGNTVSRNLCNHSSCGPNVLTQDSSAGILLYQAGSTSIAGNTVSNNDTGIYNLVSGTTAINGNQVISNRYEGIVLDQGNATVAMNLIDGGNFGVVAVSFSGANANSAGTLTCNRITGTSTGISLIDQNLADTFVPAIAANENIIEGNALGIDGSGVPAGPPMDAQDNFWGCAAGPGATGCDSVVGNVQAFPFAAAEPACAYCSVDSDCDDGLVCNGRERCNLGTNTCQTQPGTAIDCSSLNDSCHAGTCEEPGICVANPQPDGTSCNAGDTCQTGVCTGDYSLSVGTARLRCNTGKSARLNNGSVFVTAIVNDEDTGGSLATDLNTAGRVTLKVQDTGGQFHTTVSFANCKTPRKGTILCNDRSSNTSAKFIKLPLYKTSYGLLYKLTVTRTRLGTSDAGSVQPSGSVHVVLHQSTVDRPDDIVTCSTFGKSGVVCRN